VNEKGDKKNFEPTPTMKDDYKKMYLILEKLKFKPEDIVSLHNPTPKEINFHLQKVNKRAFELSVQKRDEQGRQGLAFMFFYAGHGVQYKEKQYLVLSGVNFSTNQEE